MTISISNNEFKSVYYFPLTLYRQIIKTRFIHRVKLDKNVLYEKSVIIIYFSKWYLFNQCYFM